MNVAIVQGALSRPPRPHQLASGDHLVAFDVTVRTTGLPTESVPVVWFAAPARAHRLEAGTEVLVTGRVRRRFFRTPSGTASRTEVVAESVVPVRHRKRVAAALAAAAQGLAGDP